MKSTLNAALGNLGYEIRRKRNAPPPAPAIPVSSEPPTRVSFHEGLQQIQRLGWQPATILDVGGAHGSFTRAAHTLFPAARCVMVEPLQEFRAGLEALAQQIPNTSLESVAAGKADGTATFHVHRDWDGSSLYRESEGPQVDGVAREVPMKTLDTLSRGHNLQGPFLLKVDVQGAELDVLSGAATVLPQCDYVLLEVTLFNFFIGGAQFADVVAFMYARGFVPYDVYALLYRPLDDALSQLDLAFVKQDGVFRQHHAYASPEQRAAQDKRFDAYHAQHTEKSSAKYIRLTERASLR